MNLLLLLSALLSALTGVGATRGAHTAPAVAERVQAAAAVATRVAAVATRPVPMRMTLATIAAAPVRIATPRVFAIPVWTMRRRE